MPKINLTTNEVRVLKLLVDFAKERGNTLSRISYHSYGGCTELGLSFLDTQLAIKKLDSKGFFERISPDSGGDSIFLDHSAFDYFENSNEEENKEFLEEPKNYFISLNRIQEIEDCKNQNFDTTYLVELLKEMNTLYRTSSYIALIALSRTVLNHIPPVFGNFNTFEQLCGGYGKKSMKLTFNTLNDTIRNIADHYLHTKIDQKTTLPNRSTISYIANFDFLLQEIIVCLSKSA